MKIPPWLGYSLNNRYRPRLQACRGAGKDDMTIINKHQYTDERFCEFIGITEEEKQCNWTRNFWAMASHGGL